MKKFFLILVFFLAACDVHQQVVFPENIHEEQVIAMSKIEGQAYALVARRNVNNPLFDVPLDFETTFSGVLVKQENQWLPFAEVVSQGSVNNPLSLWKEDGQWFLTVVDSSGAGSGEGYAKLFAAETPGIWELSHCWYHVPEDEAVMSLQQARVAESEDSILRNSSGSFEQVMADKEGVQQVIPLPECGNAEVRRI